MYRSLSPSRLPPSSFTCPLFRLSAARRDSLENPFRINTCVTVSKQTTSSLLESTLTQKPGEGALAAGLLVGTRYPRLETCNTIPAPTHKPSAAHSALEKCPGNTGMSFIATRMNDTSAPSAAIPRTRALDSTSASEPHAASHPSADAIDPTSVTGTSSASPRNTPSSVPPAIAAMATPGVWNTPCNFPNPAGTVPRRPNENNSRLAATKFPLKHWHSPRIATTKIMLTGQRAPIACSNAIAVANLFPSSDCHGAATETAAIAST